LAANETDAPANQGTRCRLVTHTGGRLLACQSIRRRISPVAMISKDVASI
jgi:hypothetical protein